MDPVFASAAAVCVGSGLVVVSRRNPVYSAVSLLACFLAFAVIYLKLDAPFLAALHVLVYTGAILVLFLFVIMLLNLKPDEFGEEYPLPARLLAAALCAGLFALLALPMARDPRLWAEPAQADPGYGGIETVGKSLFTVYGLPFELISVLIIVAIFGGVMLAKRRI